MEWFLLYGRRAREGDRDRERERGTEREAAVVPEVVFHAGDDLHHLRDHVLPDAGLQGLLLLPLALHLALQDVYGPQESLERERRMRERERDTEREIQKEIQRDRKSTRLNSSHL